MGLLTSPAWATTTDVASAWPVDSQWLPYRYSGSPLRDPEGGSSPDKTNGGASFSAEVDIASGWTTTNNTCNPANAGTQCGTQNSVFWYYDDKSAGSNTDGVLFLRMRVNADPRGSGGQSHAFSASHWNFLISIQGTVGLTTPTAGTRTYGEDIVGPQDAKEFWIDVNGGGNLNGSDTDRVHIFYANNATGDSWAGGVTGNQLPGGNNARKPDNILGCNETTAGFHMVNSFPACNSVNQAQCLNTSNQDLSHTRVIPITDGTGEYYIDVQVPASAFTDSCGTYSTSNDNDNGTTVSIVPGNQIINDNTNFELAYSTSDSGTNPLQKDYIGDCDASGANCYLVYGDFTTTPVTLASFSAQPTAGGVRFEWTTSIEAAIVGFNLYVVNGDEEYQLNDELIPSHVIDSTTPQYYDFTVGSVPGHVFYIEDVDILGKARRHGPFELGESHGEQPSVEPINWQSNRAERAQKQLANHNKRVNKHFATAQGAASADLSVQVTQTGIQRITDQALLAKGVDLVGRKAQNLRLADRKGTIPVLIGNPGQGNTFQRGSYLEFHGEALDTLYTKTNVYTLTQGNGEREILVDPKPAPKKAPAVAYYLETVTVERERTYNAAAPHGDPWFDAQMMARGQDFRQDFPITVDGYVNNAAPVTLNVDLWGMTDWPGINPDHHIQVMFNGVLVADKRFNGLVHAPLSVALLPGTLREGANTLTVVIPNDLGVQWDISVLNSYSLAYPRAFVAKNGQLAFQGAGQAFEVKGLPSNAVRVYRQANNGQMEWLKEVEVQADGAHGYRARFAGTPAASRYWVYSENHLSAPVLNPARINVDIRGGQADYLIIAHSDFIDDLDDLVAFHERRGLSVRVVDVQDVYAQFSGGVIDPEAIRTYIRTVAKQSGVRFVLLVGGDTYDYFDYLRLGSISFIPSLYTKTGPLSNFTPADPLYTDLDGDRVPDLPIGRLPVRNSTELATVIGKTLAYANKAYGQTAVMAADKFDGSTSFSAVSDTLIERLPAGWMVQTAYIDELGAKGAFGALVGEINMGVALTQYVGHSSPTLWSYSPLFRASDVAKLFNNGLPTVVVQWGCWNTYYVDPRYTTLGHTFLLQGDRGAAAVMGATGLANIQSEQALGERLLPYLTQPGKTIGEAVQQAKRDIAVSDFADVILGWTLLGDPALKVAP
jgi:hypothetical protein